MDTNINALFPGMWISIIKIRWFNDSLIFIMEIPILGNRANIKALFSRYGDFHYKEKRDLRPSYLYNRYSWTGKTTSLYWNGPLFVVQHNIVQWIVQVHIHCTELGVLFLCHLNITSLLFDSVTMYCSYVTISMWLLHCVSDTTITQLCHFHE